MTPTVQIMARKRGTGLTTEQAEHLAAELRVFLSRYENNATTMARAWGVSQPQLSQILSGRGRGAGVAVLCRLRMHSGRTIDDLLGLPPLGPTLDDKIRAAVVKAVDDLETTKHPARLPKRPTRERET